MAEYQINLKYNGVDNWVDLPVNSDSLTNTPKRFVQENADGNKSYLNMGASIDTHKLSTAISDQYSIYPILAYLRSAFNRAEIKVDGAIKLADVTYNRNKTVQNLFSNVTATFNIEIINE